MSVLLIVYNYDEREGATSERLTAFNIVQEIRKRHSALIVTSLPQSSGSRVISLPVSKKFDRFAALAPLKPRYAWFMVRAYLCARTRVHKYDIVHHITPISLRYPNPIAGLSRNFIWGPVGGSVPYPPGFDSIERREGALRYIRRLDAGRPSWDPMLRATMKHSARIVVTTQATVERLPERYRGKAAVIPEGLDVSTVDKHRDLDNDQMEGRYIFGSGRLIPYKGIDLLIRAFGQLRRARDVKLWISGRGPEQAHIEQVIADLGLRYDVKLLGRLPRHKNIRSMENALFCVFPALTEAFGHVNLEAMAMSKPIVASNWGGPKDLVDEGVTGYKVLGSGPEDHVNQLAARMQLLLDNPNLREKMGAAGRRRVTQEYALPKVGAQYEELYSRLLARA